jgi:hypothetical protein
MDVLSDEVRVINFTIVQVGYKLPQGRFGLQVDVRLTKQSPAIDSTYRRLLLLIQLVTLLLCKNYESTSNSPHLIFVIFSGIKIPEVEALAFTFAAVSIK